MNLLDQVLAIDNRPNSTFATEFFLQLYLTAHPATVDQLTALLPSRLSPKSKRVMLSRHLNRMYDARHIGIIGEVRSSEGGRGKDVWAGRPWFCGSCKTVESFNQPKCGRRDCCLYCTRGMPDTAADFSPEDICRILRVSQVAVSFPRFIFVRRVTHDSEFPRDAMVSRASLAAFDIAVCPWKRWNEYEISELVRQEAGIQDAYLLLVVEDLSDIEVVWKSIGLDTERVLVTTFNMIPGGPAERLPAFQCGKPVSILSGDRAIAPGH